MDLISLIKKPIERELYELTTLFQASLSSTNPLLQEMLKHIGQRSGKMMRPMLVLLMAKRFGEVSSVTLHAAATLELLHTASLVHDDVVDDSAERRGLPSVNALFNNKLSVLAGDYLLSTALAHSSMTQDVRIISLVSSLGKSLAEGEILQLSNVSNEEISEQVYFDIIRKKTASLFEACAQAGALSVSATDDDVEWARRYGEIVGITFQIKDDIFDYFNAADVIGKPTGNDMHEGKITLPALHVLLSTKDEAMLEVAYRVKVGRASNKEIAQLISFTKENGGITYAEQVMQEYVAKAYGLLEECPDEEIRTALKAYLDYAIDRKK